MYLGNGHRWKLIYQLYDIICIFFQILKNGRVAFYLNGKDETYGNWMRYINCSRIEEEQNMIALQFHGSIYYRVYKDVAPGKELLVWYG